VNIASCNPVRNVVNNGMIDAISRAFAEIEIQDIRVKRITLERDRYEQLITEKGSLGYPCQSNHIRVTEEEVIVETLFGAKLEIGEESKVFGERNMIPSALYAENMTNNQFELCAKIEFINSRISTLRMRSNLTILIKSRAKPIRGASSSEMVAINTLREMITESDFRKYIIHGFILVKGQSGRIYQIFRTRDHTKVWDNGVLVEEVCVRLKDRKIPPTDNVTAFKVLIETDENEFKKLGNVYKMNTLIAA